MIHRIPAVLALTLAGGAIAQDDAARPVTVTLRPSATLRGLDVHVGDLADVTSIEPELARRVAGLRIADRPAIGFGRTFDREDVAAALIASGVPGDAFAIIGARGSVAHPATRELTETEVRAVTDPILRATLDDESGVETEFELMRPLPTERVPPGRQGLQLRPRLLPERRATTRATVAVDVVVDGATWRTLQVDYRLRRFAEATTVTRGIARGETIRPGDLEPLRVELGSRNGHLFAADTDVVGQVATRQLTAGRPLRTGDVAAPAVVRRDDPVRLVSQRGRIRIAVRAIALEAGAVGDRIQVRSLAGGQPVQAVVRAPGLVVVPGPADVSGPGGALR